jgi:hypothetical protein
MDGWLPHIFTMRFCSRQLDELSWKFQTKLIGQILNSYEVKIHIKPLDEFQILIPGE